MNTAPTHHKGIVLRTTLIMITSQLQRLSTYAILAAHFILVLSGWEQGHLDRKNPNNAFPTLFSRSSLTEQSQPPESLSTVFWVTSENTQAYAPNISLSYTK